MQMTLQFRSIVLLLIQAATRSPSFIHGHAIRIWHVQIVRVLAQLFLRRETASRSIVRDNNLGIFFPTLSRSGNWNSSIANAFKILLCERDWFLFFFAMRWLVSAGDLINVLA